MLSSAIIMLGTLGINEKANAQILLNENFSSASNLTPPSGWSNVDNGGSFPTMIWNFSNPGGRTITGNFSGPFAILDSDYLGYDPNTFDGYDQNTDLITPAFDASTGGSYQLEFDASFRYYTGSLGSVEVWNGSAWTTVLSLTANSGYPNPAIHQTIDITAATGGSAAAKVRFHYEGNYGYWFAVDNVKITKLLCTAPTAVFSQTTNCPANQFSVNVNISSLGSATSLAIKDGGTTIATATSTGNVVLGPFASGTTHALTLVHNIDSACNVTSSQTYFCPPPNDLICNAITLTVDGAADCQTTGTATAVNDPSDIGNCSTPNNTLWYKFTPSTNGSKMITMTNPPTGDPLSAWVFIYTVTDPCGAPVYNQVPTFDGNCQAGSTGVNGSTATFLTSSLNAGTEYYMIIDGNSGDVGAFCISISTPPPPPSCVTAIAPANATTDLDIYPNPPTFNWNGTAGATGYQVYFGTSAAGEMNLGTITDTFVQITDMDYSTQYFWYIVPVGPGGAAVGCATNEFSFTTEALPPVPANDEAPGAVTLVVGATCSGNPYSNVFAGLGVGEPYPNCNTESVGEHSLWFKFVAPASGSVRVTTDNGGTLGTMTDTKIGLFSVIDSSDYSTFNIIACDDDNGVTGSGYTSTIYTSSLTGGQTYYVEVDGYSSTTVGSFCVQVEEINPSMLSNSAVCADLQTPEANEASYTGWITLVDQTGKLVATLRNPAGGEGGDYSGSYNIDGTGFEMPRQDGAGIYYLSRNYMINNSGISTPVDVRFYFHPGEIATLAGVTGNATNLTNLNVTKQESTTCNADFSEGNGTTSVLMQNANGSVNGVSWIQVTTSSFSNFYLMGGITPLALTLTDISAANMGRSNQVKWTTAKEDAGDYFELERGKDAKNFAFLSKIQANKKPSNYTFNDNNPLEKENFYRLKMISKDGKFTYSKVVSAIVPADNGFAVEAYPNPAKNNVKVKVIGSQNGAITLADIAGRIVYHGTVKGNEINIDLSKIANGVYFLKYVDNNLTKTIKLNKQ